MATERELKTLQEATLYDILRLIEAGSEEERSAMLNSMYARAQSGMTIEEIAAVKERVAMARG